MGNRGGSFRFVCGFFFGTVHLNCIFRHRFLSPNPPDSGPDRKVSVFRKMILSVCCFSAELLSGKVCWADFLQFLFGGRMCSSVPRFPFAPVGVKNSAETLPDQRVGCFCWIFCSQKGVKKEAGVKPASEIVCEYEWFGTISPPNTPLQPCVCSWHNVSWPFPRQH